MATEREGKPTGSVGIPWKLRGQVAYGLIRDLAEGTQSNARLARKYDVNASTISEFKIKNADRIAAVRADLDNRMAGLWAAEKERRIAEYQQDIALLNDSIEAQEAWIRELERQIADSEDGLLADDDPSTLVAIKRLPRAERELGAMLKRKHAALRSISEELGQLPNRMTLTLQGGEQPVRHEIVGVDPDDI